METASIPSLECVQDEAALRELLLEEVGRALLPAKKNGATGSRFLRIVLPVEFVDPFAWLDAQPLAGKLFWAGRTGGVTIAAAGIADEVSSADLSGLDVLDERVRRLRAAGSEARYYGGLRFDATRPACGEWEDFGAVRFILPRFELVAEESRTQLVCNLLLPRDVQRREQVAGEIKSLCLPAAPLAGRLPLPESRRDVPSRSGWTENIEWALDRFADGSLGKVVFARRATFGFPERVSPMLLLKQLREATPGCFHFCFQTGTDAAFLGASPERLFVRDGCEILSEAVAGTRPRGESQEDDARLRDELLGSSKELLEHAYVQHNILKTLGPLSTEVQADAEPSELVLARGRHLFSRVQARLREGVGDVDVIRALHPTPAVGGHPTREAMKSIRDREAFDRGWYAGPVGWIGANGAEFAVGIRSGLVRGHELSLYSGAGIVPGSEADAEYAEIEQKISDFTRVLGLDQRRA